MTMQTTGIDLSDPMAVDDYLATLQDRVERAERLLAQNLTAGSFAGGSTGTTGTVDLTSEAAAAFKRLSPAQKTAAIQARQQQEFDEKTGMMKAGSDQISRLGRLLLRYIDA